MDDEAQPMSRKCSMSIDERVYLVVSSLELDATLGLVGIDIMLTRELHKLCHRYLIAAGQDGIFKMVTATTSMPLLSICI